MQPAKNDDHRIQNNRLAEFPALAALRLTADNLNELSRQGVVCEETRGSRKYYKLRFRSHGKQVVRYVGCAKRAMVVKDELAILQAESKALRELKVRVKFTNKMIRETKSMLEPVLKANGFIFHGLAIRRPHK